MKNEFHNSKNINDTAEEFLYDPKFKQRVTSNYSGVHIPVEIYEGGRCCVALWANFTHFDHSFSNQ